MEPKFSWNENASSVSKQPYYVSLQCFPYFSSSYDGICVHDRRSTAALNVKDYYGVLIISFLSMPCVGVRGHDGGTAELLVAWACVCGFVSVRKSNEICTKHSDDDYYVLVCNAPGRKLCWRASGRERKRGGEREKRREREKENRSDRKWYEWTIHSPKNQINVERRMWK